MLYNIDNNIEIMKDIEIIPSDLLISRTKALVRSANSHKKNNINWLPVALSAGFAMIALVFAIYALVNFNGSSSFFSDETAAIYSLDINPSIEIGVDADREVIQVKSLNDDGKQLLKQVNCMGIDIKECIEILIKKSIELGYLDENDENYIILSEVMLQERFESMNKDIESITQSYSINIIFLIGDIKNKENADLKGISTGKEIFQKKAREIGIEIDDSDLLDKSIKELVNNSSSSTKEIFETNKVYTTPTFSTKSYEGYIELVWDRIENNELNGYKIVISRYDADPSYPDNGYLIYITDKDQTLYIIDNSIKYNNGDYGNYLVNNNEYYINITALYDNKNVSGDAILTRFISKPVETTVTETTALKETEAPLTSTNISGTRASDGTINLSWDKISSSKFQGYKVVASSTNEAPKYPDDGYIKYITDKTITTLTIDEGFSGTLVKGTEYYFSITVLYKDENKAGNSVKLKYMEKEVAPTITHKSSKITGVRLTDGSVKLKWEAINTSDFQGYKVVASSTDPNPKYPDDGYIRYITDKSTTSLLVNESFKDKLNYGTEYYFSITVLYKNEKVAGNAVKLKYMDITQTPSYTKSNISGQRLENGSVSLSWDKIDDPAFSGYKVVASATNPNPSYPNDGYIKYITDKDSNSLLVDASYISKLTPGVEYYFSITVLYDNQKVPGNSVKVKYLDENAQTELMASEITGQRLENGSVSLSWDKIDDPAFSGYKVVASATNPNPSYPNDGYIKYITDKDSNSLLVDASYISKLTPGVEYYFSITVLYDNQKVPGNSVKVKYLDGDVQTDYVASNITGVRLSDGNIQLNWEQIDVSGFDGYKVVASSTNPDPAYPDDGYISWITNSSTTSLLVNESFDSKLTEGTSYYFSITALYNGHSVKIAGNSVYLKYR